MTYDSWKLRSDRDEQSQPDPNFCQDCGHPENYCDCPCCIEQPVAEKVAKEMER